MHVLCQRVQKIVPTDQPSTTGDRHRGTTPQNGAGLLSWMNLLESGQKTIYLGSGIIVGQPNAQRSAALLQIQPLHEVKRVVVSIPAENASLRQCLSKLTRRMTFQRQHDGRHASG